MASNSLQGDQSKFLLLYLNCLQQHQIQGKFLRFTKLFKSFLEKLTLIEQSQALIECPHLYFTEYMHYYNNIIQNLTQVIKTRKYLSVGMLILNKAGI